MSLLYTYLAFSIKTLVNLILCQDITVIRSKIELDRANLLPQNLKIHWFVSSIIIIIFLQEIFYYVLVYKQMEKGKRKKIMKYLECIIIFHCTIINLDLVSWWVRVMIEKFKRRKMKLVVL